MNKTMPMLNVIGELLGLEIMTIAGPEIARVIQELESTLKSKTAPKTIPVTMITHQVCSINSGIKSMM